MYFPTLTSGLKLGDPKSGYPLLDGGSAFDLPPVSTVAQTQARRRDLYVGTSEQANFEAPGLRDGRHAPSYTQRAHRTQVYDPQADANNVGLVTHKDDTYKWAISGDWFRRSQVEWESLLRHTRIYDRDGSVWVDHGQFNHFPMRVSPIQALAGTGSSVPFI